MYGISIKNAFAAASKNYLEPPEPQFEENGNLNIVWYFTTVLFKKKTNL